MSSILPPARRFAVRSLLATTSAAALLLAGPAPAGAGQSVANQTVAAVTNPAGGATTSVFITGATVTGDVTNAGTITPGKVTQVTVPFPFASATAIAVNNSAVGGKIVNSGTITATQNARTVNGTAIAVGLSVNNSTVGGGIVNSGTISATATGFNGFSFKTTGILITGASTVTGGITNRGTITASGSGINIFGFGDTVTGGITNRGTITASGSGINIGINIVGGTVSGGITNSGTISASGGIGGGIVLSGGTVSGGITNSGTISASGGIAGGIVLAGGTVSGGITNSGTIHVAGTGIGIIGFSTVSGGIVNTGTISGGFAAINLSSVNSQNFAPEGAPTTITQAGGALIGSVLGSGNANADMLNFTGGRIVLSPTQSVSGFGTYNQTGGTLVLGVTPSTAAGSFASVSAGTITLGGALNVALQLNGTTNYAASQTYKDAIAATNSLTGTFTTVTTSLPLFTASVSPDATTPNALDVTLRVSPTGLAASAQNLTQNLRFGLEAPAVLVETVQNRLVAASGADTGATLASLSPAQQIAGGSGVLTDGGDGAASAKGGVWARAFGLFGSAPASGPAVSYQENREGVILGADWRVGEGVVLGLAGTYATTTAYFADASRTNVHSYEGAVYAGWSGGPWYATGLAGLGANSYATTRQLTPFGLTGAATSTPTGQSYSSYGEAGYGLRAGGYTLTPYAGLGYVHSHIEGFTEEGGFFGALTTGAADANSLATTLGVRASTRVSLGEHGVLVPELRAGWSHEFLDAAQTINASLTNVPGSLFSATGANFGRESALIGAGVTYDLATAVKLFADYDGKLTGSFQEHAFSAGLRVRF